MARALTRKTESAMTEAVTSILETPPLVKKDVRYFWGDLGSENISLTKTLLPKYSISFFATKNKKLKASFAEMYIKKLQ